MRGQKVVSVSFTEVLRKICRRVTREAYETWKTRVTRT